MFVFMQTLLKKKGNKSNSLSPASNDTKGHQKGEILTCPEHRIRHLIPSVAILVFYQALEACSLFTEFWII